MGDFKGADQILLQPNDNIGKTFQVTVAESETSNDGWIGFGLTVASVVAIIYDKNEVDVTTDIIVGTPSVVNNVIAVQFKYPVLTGPGRYKMTFILTLSNGDIRETEFERIYARDK